MILESDPVAVSANVLDPENSFAPAPDDDSEQDEVDAFDQVRNTNHQICERV